MAERVAINSPIQGTAADIIKLAMINIHRILQERKLKSKLILQVHDELIFDCVPEELEEMKVLVQEQMEGAVSLSVQLKVDMGTGQNWYDLK
jgi:DNA polymerase-1